MAADLDPRRAGDELEQVEHLEVDTLVSACPWSERPLSTAADEAGDLEVLDLFELVARSAGIEVGGHAKPPATEVRP